MTCSPLRSGNSSQQIVAVPASGGGKDSEKKGYEFFFDFYEGIKASETKEEKKVAYCSRRLPAEGLSFLGVYAGAQSKLAREPCQVN